jgi:hypothetical protein
MGIHEGLTFGRGRLDDFGYWSIPCAICARAHEKAYPESTPCWPFEGQVFNEHECVKHDEDFEDEDFEAEDDEPWPFDCYVLQDDYERSKRCPR